MNKKKQLKHLPEQEDLAKVSEQIERGFGQDHPNEKELEVKQ